VDSARGVAGDNIYEKDLKHEDGDDLLPFTSQKYTFYSKHDGIGLL
jgi:hypothetical protein